MAKEKKNGFVAEFKQFILRGNVVDLAVGVGRNLTKRATYAEITKRTKKLLEQLN